MKCVVGVFGRYLHAELAVDKLKEIGVPVKRDLSIAMLRTVVRNHLTQFDRLHPHAHSLGPIRAANIGTLMGLLLGVGGVSVPNVGATVTAGALTNALAKRNNDLAEGLVALGFDKETAALYEQDVANSNILLIIHTDESAALDEKQLTAVFEDFSATNINIVSENEVVAHAISN